MLNVALNRREIIYNQYKESIDIFKTIMQL